MTHAEAAEAATPLLATKLHAPDRRREVVARPRLTDRLVVGPPAGADTGFGTGGVREDDTADRVVRRDSRGRAVRRRGWRSTPVTTTRRVFGSYVVAALQAVVPQVGARRHVAAAVVPAVAGGNGDADQRLGGARRRRRPRPRRLPRHRVGGGARGGRLPARARCHRSSISCWRVGPILPCRWRACGPAASCSRSAPRTSDSPPTRPRPTSTRRWGCT